MNRFIVLSFLVMGWGYYELSGGADFVPEQRPVVAQAPDPLPETAPEPVVAAADTTEPADDALDSVTVVTRADTETLDALPEAEDTAAAAEAIELQADSVADALSQALADPVVNTGEPEALPEEEQTASAPPPPPTCAR